MLERAARVRWYPSYCISVLFRPLVGGGGDHHGNHCGDVDVDVLAAVTRVETADDLCGKGGFATARDAGDTDQDAAGREGVGEECYTELWSYSFRIV